MATVTEGWDNDNTGDNYSAAKWSTVTDEIGDTREEEEESIITG